MDPVNTRPKGMSIAIGNNAKIDLGTRTEEALLSFGYGKERGKDDDRFGYTIAGNTEAKENLENCLSLYRGIDEVNPQVEDLMKSLLANYVDMTDDGVETLASLENRKKIEESFLACAA